MWRLAANPAEKLLDLDPVEASDEGVIAQTEDRNAIAVELFPFPHRNRVAIDGTKLELHPELIQELGHRS